MSARFTERYLDATAARRPPGYRAAVLALARRTPDGTYEISPESLAQLRAQFPPPLPPFRHRIRSFLATLLQWLRNGCPLTPRALFTRRQSICHLCPHWRPAAALTAAHCHLCGCATALKLRDPASTCPDHPPRW